MWTSALFVLFNLTLYVCVCAYVCLRHSLSVFVSLGVFWFQCCFSAFNLCVYFLVYMCVCGCVFASMGPRSKRRCCHRLSAASWFPSIDSQPINSLNDAIIRPPSPPHLKLRGLFWINPDHFVCKLHNCIAFRFLRQPNWRKPWVWMPNERHCPSKRLCRTQAETIREVAVEKQLFLFLFRPSPLANLTSYWIQTDFTPHLMFLTLFTVYTELHSLPGVSIALQAFGLFRQKLWQGLALQNLEILKAQHVHENHSLHC